MKKRFNLFHPYSLATIVAIVGFGILTYIGLTAPTPEEQDVEVKGVSTQTESYSQVQLADYGTDLIVTNLSEIIDLQNIKFTAYASASVTYDLMRLKNELNETLKLQIQPKQVENLNMKNLRVKLLIEENEIELYTNSEKPNKDSFIIQLDSYQSKELKLVVTADKLLDETAQGEILFQIVEM